ncbi:MAG TPA: flagellar hook protein FlgE [Acidimicrobiales bacterium]|nr:flagellar hook protein FlgE [Acidimicrobiales bacterium]
MDRSLLAAVSGIDANQTYLDTIGNNIANVNTVGYKQQSIDFVDLLSEQIAGASAPPATANAGAGINAVAVGSGVRVGAVSNDLSEGSLQQTNQPNDVAINGNGFLIAQQGGQQIFTRAGQLTPDANGNLATPTGGLIEGWQAVNGAVNSSAPIGAVTIPAGQVIPANATTEITMGGNLPAWSGSGTATPVSTTIHSYDALGTTIPVTLTYTPVTGTADQWSVQGTATLPGGTTQNLWSTATPPTVTFDPTTGQVSGITTNGVTPVPANANGSFSLPVATMPAGYTFPPGDVWNIDFPPSGTAASFTQFAGQSTAGAVSQDGAAAGTLTSYSINASGMVVGSFSNGQTENIAQLALATFSNPGGLETIGNLDYVTTPNSGQASVGTPGTGGRGSLIGGSLESSNVNLATQLTNLVIAQEAYQANTKVVQTDSTVAQTLVQMA